VGTPPPEDSAFGAPSASAPPGPDVTAGDSAESEGGVDRLRGPPAPRFLGPWWVRVAAVVTAVAASVLAGLSVVPLRAPVPLDPERVVIFPLAHTDPGPTTVGEGWDVALAIGAAFEYAEPLRWIDGRAWLPQTERDDPSRLTPALAHGIARSRGARYYVDGAIRGSPARPAVVLRLHDVEGDSLVTQQTASAPGGGEAGLAGLGLRAALGVLQPLLAPGVSVDLGPIADRDAGAIALWIRGESAYRTARFAGALDFFQRALEQDSLLVFAAVKGALAAGWLHREVDMAHLLEVSQQHQDLLPPRYRLLRLGLAEMASGRATAAIEAFESAVWLDPTWADGWMALAEARYHLLPGTLRHPFGTGESGAVQAFREALALDDGFVPPVVHLAEHVGRRGSVAELDDLVVRLEQAGAEGLSTGWARLLLDCRRNALDRFVEGTGNLLYLGEASRALATGAAHPHCAEAGFRRILEEPGSSAGERWGGLLGLNGVLLAQGRFHDSGALLDRTLAEGLPGVHALRIFSALAGAPFGERALRSVEVYRQAFGEHYQGAPPEARWLLGIWHARHGDPALARVLGAGMEEEAGDRSSPLLRTLGQALQAHAYLGEGDPDAAEAILEDLASAHPPATLAWGLAAPLPFERLALAEILLSRGRFAEAYAVAAILDHPQPNAFVPLVPASLRVRAEAADGLGRSQVSAEHRGRLAALGWTDDGIPPSVSNP
jgi:tetratricopeptide (TPR) repeat protein